MPVSESLTKTVFEGDDKTAEQTKRSNLQKEAIEGTTVDFQEKA